MADHFFKEVFNVSLCNTFAKYPERCVLGSSPVLSVASKVYGESATLQWLCLLLVNLSEYMGAKQKMSPYQMQTLAQNILTDYFYLSMSEIMLFFSMAQRGKLGILDFGTFDPIRITYLLQEFVRNHRNRIIEKEEQRKTMERLEREKQNAVHRKGLTEQVANIANKLTFDKK